MINKPEYLLMMSGAISLFGCADQQTKTPNVIIVLTDDHYQVNGVYKQFKGYCTDVWFNEARRFIRSYKNKPFFCYLAISKGKQSLINFFENEKNFV